MADTPQADEHEKKKRELEERRASIRKERKALAFGRAGRYALLLLGIALAALLAFKALNDQYRLERARIRAEAERLHLERQQVATQRMNEALRQLAAILEGAGTPAEKQRAFQAMLAFYISINVLPKEADKLTDWASLGAKALSALLAALKDTKAADCGQCQPVSACACCCPPPAPSKPASRKPPAERK
jgi:hypothetical protein